MTEKTSSDLMRTNLELMILRHDAPLDGVDFDEGWVFVYHGNDSNEGLVGGSTAKPFEASWTAESNQPGAGFGRSVASAGNVNCDSGGISDVIVGAYEYSADESFESTQK